MDMLWKCCSTARDGETAIPLNGTRVIERRSCNCIESLEVEELWRVLAAQMTVKMVHGLANCAADGARRSERLVYEALLLELQRRSNSSMGF
jgi:hypothetical protein